ncbi:hypothetical protein C4D60_Mb03t06490 [Musa balbisiana]|uniref:Pentacotripeptide-repeat region of PRORP domain-containing protein n=1 Tax=Musa balbisiana TaxID=52838 RepID=A0A4S8JAF2_MUSBA|nr:hypothetical protein C4D60_Mb03t06490 [Musa balbisiana]
MLLCRSAKPLPHAMSPRDVFLHNLRIGSLGRAGQLDAARQLFDRMPTRDTVSWNAILTAHWQNSDLEGSKRLFDSMPQRNTVSWNSIIAGCLENARPDEALDYFAKMPLRNVASWNAIVSGLVKYGRFEEAERLFEAMPAKNVISYTAMVDGLARKGEVDRARDLFDRMPKKNAVSWAAMISGCVENGRYEEARYLFDRIPEKNLAAITAMITGYCKEGNVEKARSIFNGIRHKDLICWNAMMAGYVHNGHGEEALKLHIQMQKTGMKPDHATLIAVVTACSALGLLQQGKRTHAFAIKTKFLLNVSLCNALITMYSKCGCIGHLEKACKYIREMPYEAETSAWGAVLAACRMNSHVKLGELVAKKLILSDSRTSGAYVMLSNIYAAAGMWREVVKVRGLMKQNGAKKQPGYSWIQIADKLHLDSRKNLFTTCVSIVCINQWAHAVDIQKSSHTLLQLAAYSSNNSDLSIADE